MSNLKKRFKVSLKKAVKDIDIKASQNKNIKKLVQFLLINES